MRKLSFVACCSSVGLTGDSSMSESESDEEAAAVRQDEIEWASESEAEDIDKGQHVLQSFVATPHRHRGYTPKVESGSMNMPSTCGIGQPGWFPSCTGQGASIMARWWMKLLIDLLAALPGFIASLKETHQPWREKAAKERWRTRLWRRSFRMSLIALHHTRCVRAESGVRTLGTLGTL